MNQKRTNSLLSRILRRTSACFLAILAIWMLSLTAPKASPIGLLERWGSDATLVTAALAAQLQAGQQPQTGDSSLSTWERVLLSESSLLSGWGRNDNRPERAAPGLLETDDEETLPKLSPANKDDIVERFFQTDSTQAYDHVEGVYILNRTSKTLDVAALAAAPLEISLPNDEKPQILIMHTHGSEAYAQEGDDVYSETDTARTTDTHYNIIRVGDEIERIFTEMGLSVLHDETLYDYPNYNGSYERSRAAVEQYKKDYPSIQIVLDVHRDALVAEDGTVYKAVTEIDGEKTAQMLFVIGTDDGGAAHPNWDKNLSLAMRVQHRMNTLWPGLARPINLRTSRFNQEITQGSILVEVGSHGNTLQEALAGARNFARAAGQVFQELKE